MKLPLTYLFLAILLFGTVLPLPAAPADTAFTYQGQLKQGGTAAAGRFDFQFSLFPEDSGGGQIGSTVDMPEVTVSGGLFQTPLDFGLNPFIDGARWLEIAVRPAGVGGFTTLSPRQELTATPYALKAKTAESASYAASAGSVPASGLPANVARTDAAQTFTGAVSFTGLARMPAAALTVPSPIVRWGLSTGRPVPPQIQDVQDVAAGNSFFLALLNSGKIRIWGDTSAEQILPAAVEDDYFSAISAGDHHTLALTMSGWVRTWGNVDNGKLTVPFLPDITSYTAVAAGAEHSVALRSDGVIVAWGLNNFNQTTPNGLSGYKAIACGRYNTYAIRTNGTVDAWGRSDAGQTTLPFISAPATQVAAGAAHAAALLNDGRVVAWGQNTSGQATVPTSPVNLTIPRAAGDPLRPVRLAVNQSACLALLTNGTVVGWGSSSLGSIPPAALSGLTAIGSGPAAYDFLAVRTPGPADTTTAGAAYTEGQNVFTERNTFHGANLFTAANTFSAANTFAGINTFTEKNFFPRGLIVSDTGDTRGLFVTNSNDSANWHLRSFGGAQSGYGVLAFNGSLDGPENTQLNSGKALWRLYADQRGATDLFGISNVYAGGSRNVLQIDTNGNIAMSGAPSAMFKLDVNGPMRTIGPVNITSDRRYKQDIQPLKGALEKVSRLRGVSYDWNRAAFPDKNFSDRRQLGFIAQDVQEVLPELVTADSQGYLSVAYTAAVPVLVEAVKEQQQQVKELRAENAELKARLDRLEQAMNQKQP